MKIHFTSNLFLSRPESAKERGFETVDEMNEAIINNWNEKVKPGDIVYHLGNFAWDPLIAEDALNKLNGTINFMTGEWDRAIYEVVDRFPEHKILNNSILFIDSYNLILSYWPLMDWPGRDEKTIHIHGGDTYKTEVNKESIRINCNCSNWDLNPINIQTVKGIVEMFAQDTSN